MKIDSFNPLLYSCDLNEPKKVVNCSTTEKKKKRVKRKLLLTSPPSKSTTSTWLKLIIIIIICIYVLVKNILYKTQNSNSLYLINI